MLRCVTFFSVILMAPTLALAQPESREGHGRQPADRHAEIAAAPQEAQPVAPVDASIWVGPMLMIIAAMFLSAMIVGPVVRAEMQAEEPEAHGHDDHHGHASHGHH